jgi:hypothetical protein
MTIYIYTHTHTHTHVYIHICIYIYTYVYIVFVGGSVGVDVGVGVFVWCVVKNTKHANIYIYAITVTPDGADGLRGDGVGVGDISEVCGDAWGHGDTTGGADGRGAGRECDSGLFVCLFKFEFDVLVQSRW